MNPDAASEPAPVVHEAAATPAPYGRACSNCSRAKCKCIFRDSEASTCQRCHRLGKSCQPTASLRRRRVPKKTPASRTAQLEEKLNDLVTLLKSNQPSASPAAFATQPPPTETNSSYGTTTTSGPASVLTPISTPTPASSIHPPTEPTTAEAEECLARFQRALLKYFPFVHIPAGTSAAALRARRPILWLAVMSICWRAAGEQTALGDELRATLARTLILQHERSVDVLLGLLAFLGWSQYARKDRPFLSVYAALAVAVVGDLGLHKLPVVNALPPFCWKLPKMEFVEKAVEVPLTPLEEGRATLACFMVTSMLASILKKTDALRWTPRMDEYLRLLSEQPECPQDAVLVNQVKLQLIMEEVNRADWQSPSTMSALYANALRVKVDEIYAAVPPDLKTHEAILGPFHFTHLLLAESIVSDNITGDSVISLAPQRLPSSGSLERIRNLDRCVDAIRAYFDFFVTLPLVEYLGLPFAHYAYMSHNLMSLFRLTTLDDPAWDCAAVRRRVDVLAMLDHFANGVAQIPKTPVGAYMVDGRAVEMFGKFERIIMAVREQWESEMNKVMGGKDTALEEMSRAPQEAGPGETATQDAAFPLAMMDDEWFRDVFIPWEDSPFR